MSVKVRLKMKSCHFICEILPKQDFYLFQFKIAELVSQLPNEVNYKGMYYYLKQQDYGTLYDSPQANLSTIGAELREKNIDIGYKITDKAIKQAMLVMMQRNM